MLISLSSLDPGEKGGGRRAWKREEVAGAGEGDFWSFLAASIMASTNGFLAICV